MFLREETGQATVRRQALTALDMCGSTCNRLSLICLSDGRPAQDILPFCLLAVIYIVSMLLGACQDVFY